MIALYITSELISFNQYPEDPLLVLQIKIIEKTLSTKTIMN